MAGCVKVTNSATTGFNRVDVLDSNSKYQKFSLGEISRVRQTLKGLDLPSSAYICTTGTAGKLELTGDEKEPIRLCLVCDQSSKEQAVAKVRSVISKHFVGNFPIEWKDASCQIKVGNICFPSHFIHQIFLTGDPNKLDGLFYQFVKEVQDMSGEMRQKFRKHFVANHIRRLYQVINGIDTQGVDLKNGVITYRGPKQHSTKGSLLLPIQFVLDLRIIDAIRVLGHWPKDYVSFLKFMPRTIPELIDYMFQERLLPELCKQDIEDLQNAYRLGLFYSHRGQDTLKLTEAEKVQLQQAYTNTQRVLGKINSLQFCKGKRVLT